MDYNVELDGTMKLRGPVPHQALRGRYNAYVKLRIRGYGFATSRRSGLRAPSCRFPLRVAIQGPQQTFLSEFRDVYSSQVV